MANRRDLHIGITGDAGGFDKACEDAEDKARGLDRELAQLERQQTANEKVTSRTAAAVKKYGAEQDKAALAARRMGNEAEKAAKQAEQAQIRADAAADAYTRGLISEETALRAAGRAEDALERAAIKAAEAHRSAARAAEEQAQQERQLARDAALGAAAEELAVLKASGRVREHNDLLRSVRNQFGDLSKEGSGAFTEIETFGRRAATAVAGVAGNVSVLGTSGPVAIGLIIAAIEALPTVATIAGGAVALGLGGGLALAAIKAQASASDVQAAFAQLKSGVLDDLQQISAPFHATLLEIAADADAAFKSLEPSLAAAFALMAPAISRFVRYFAGSLGELDPVIRSVGVAFTNTLDTLGPEIPTIIQNIGVGIKAITDATAENPQALADFVTELSMIAREVGDSIGILIRYSNQIHTVFDVINGIANPGGGGIVKAFERITGGADSGGKALAKYKNTLGGLPSQVTPAQQASQQLAKDMQTLSSATATAADRTTALSDALTRLFDPELAAYQDTARLRQGFDDLSTALAKSHGRIGDYSAAAANAKLKFAGLLQQTEQYAKDLTRSGDSIDLVQRKLAPYILSLYRTAGANKDARALIDAFVRSVGMVPPKKGTELYNNATQQKKAVEAYQRQLNALPRSKKVDIYQVMHLTASQAYLNKRKNILGYAGGGIVHRASGGPVQHLADGGPSGMVSGPGTSTSDSILTALSNGEFVVNARSTAANRPLLDAINSGARVPIAAGAVSGASGGSSRGVDVGVLARAVEIALNSVTVQMDGKPVGQIVSRNLGQTTSLRRKTG